jgi:hypothetical protein
VIHKPRVFVCGLHDVVNLALFEDFVVSLVVLLDNLAVFAFALADLRPPRCGLFVYE